LDGPLCAARAAHPLPHPRLDRVLEVDHAEDLVVARDEQRRAAQARDAADLGADRRRHGPAAAARCLITSADPLSASEAGVPFTAG
jgi:hypothetical protein